MNRRTPVFLCYFIFLSAVLYPQEVLRFGVFPAHDPKTLLRLFSPVALKIEEATGIQVELLSAPTRSKFNERTLRGSYTLIWTCTGCYTEIHKKTGIYAIARGTPPFKGIVLVRKESRIKSIMDLKGKKIAAVGPYSIAGYLFLKEKLQKAGISNKEIKVDFVSLPESIPFKVLNRDYDAGVFSEDKYIQSAFFGSVRGKLRVLTESEPIPQAPFAVEKELDKNIVNKIQACLVSINSNNKDDAEILNALGYAAIEKTDDSGYDTFRQMYERLKPE